MLNEIRDALQKITTEFYAGNVADADEKIYDLGDRLGWKETQIDYFYNAFYKDPTHYEAEDLLPDGLVDFDSTLMSNMDLSPV